MVLKVDSRTIQYYVSCFSSLNCNKRRGLIAPHKAMLLIAMMEEISNGTITNGFVPHGEAMVRAFERTWNRYVGSTRNFKVVFQTPFYHLSNEPFWHLMKSNDYVEQKEYSLGALRKSFYGAKIDDALFNFILDPSAKAKLMRVLLETYAPNWNEEEFNMSIAAEDIGEYSTSENFRVKMVA